MPVSRAIEPLTADDDTIRAALRDAHIPALLPALAQLTGDMALLDPELTPSTRFPVLPQGGLSEAKQERARDLALAALIRYRDAGCIPAPPPSEDDLRLMMEFVTGVEVTGDYLPLLKEELAFPERDARAPRWQKDAIAPGRPFTVAVIGAGMSGILAGIRLRQAGVPYVIFEKNADVGGTWFENTYPGCRVDSSNHLYSYSFAQKVDWPYHFSTQDVLLDYFRACADEFGVRENIRFETEVTSAAWDDASCTWRLALRGRDGREEAFEAQALISAVGQLNRPKWPDIPGIDSFQGPYFHSAEWDHRVNLAGKRVAVIGTGASAAQFIPIIAEQVGELLIFQRTPNWFSPVPQYHDRVPDGLQWLFQHVPYYAQWYRFWLFWTTADGLLPAARVDASWPSWDSSVSEQNQYVREQMAAYLRRQLHDRPDLIEKVVPPYPPASKRILLDNGVWPATLKRDNVRLITDPIGAVTPAGVAMVDGTLHAVDVIIYGTGFQASRFLTPMKVTGRHGIDLHEQWAGDARAYLGIVVPNFPNFFCLYGPNTNIVVNGSIVYFSECEVHYVVESIRMLLERGVAAMDPRKDVHDAYNEWIDAGNRQMAWGVSKVNSWYKNEYGRVAQNWPFTLLEYWQQTRTPNPADYELLPLPAPVPG
jgi:4-hydroxyacetophenone monooxygenase